MHVYPLCKFLKAEMTLLLQKTLLLFNGKVHFKFIFLFDRLHIL